MARRNSPTSHRWSAALAETLGALGLLSAPLAAQTLPANALPPARWPTPTSAVAPDQTASAALAAAALPLMLDVRVNGAARGLQPFREQGGALWAEAATLRALGLRSAADASGWLRLDQQPQLQVNYDAALQRVSLVAPLDQLALDTTVLHAGPAAVAQRASASPGVLLNYDLYGTSAEHGVRSLSAFTELRAFAGNTLLSNTALSQTVSDPQSSASVRGTVRLDTVLSYDLPEQRLSLRAGDTFTSTLPWSRATRIGGLQIGRNFGLQPYRSSAPVPQLMGSATLPSQVQLYIDGIRQYSAQVPAGPFQLDTTPRINAGGNAQLVVTDALGRSTTLNFNLYDSGRLLAAGLTDWSLELGAVRRNYGTRSFDYERDPVASATWRRGITDRLTLETHAEAVRGVQLAGGGGIWQLGMPGLVAAGVAGSRHDDGHGWLSYLAWRWSQDGWSASLNDTRAHGDYRDIGSRYGSAMPRASGQASLGWGNSTVGSFNLSYLYLRPNEGERSRYASLGWMRPLGRRAFIAASANQNLDRSRDRSLSISLNWSLDSRTNLSAGWQRSGTRDTLTASAQQSTPTDGGWGWRAAARAGQGSGGGQAELNYLGSWGRATAGVSDWGGGSRQAYAGLSGGAVWMAGHPFLSRRIDNAFAVVSTDGVAQVPVQLENLPVGHTDARGLLLVVPLNAYQNNQLAIDPMPLPAELRIDRTRAIATPTDRAGTLVRFAMRPVRAATVHLVDEAGQPLALGALVSLPERAEPAIVGYDGMVYLEDLNAMNPLSVRTPAGGHCRAALAWPGEAAGLRDIGPVTCRAEARP